MRRLVADACLNAAEAARGWEVRLDEHRSFMPAGHNGPYQQLETPLRNTAHWLVTYSIAHALTGDESFKEVGLRLSAFLQRPGAFRGRYALLHRQIGTDRCNGVIGPAWVIEALARSALYLGDEDAGEMARQELESLPFDRRAGAWCRVDPDIGPRGIDYTYNHQAWLAAAAADVPGRIGQSRALEFLDRSVAGGLQVGQDGIIRHVLYTPNPRSLGMVARLKVLRKIRPAVVAEKEWGYHLYSLFPLLRLSLRFPEHPLYRSSQFCAAVDRALSGAFRDALKQNRFAYPYNAPGFEMPLLCVLREVSERDLRSIYMRQCKNTLDPATGLHTRGTSDPVTLASRIYELAMLAELSLLRKPQVGVPGRVDA